MDTEPITALGRARLSARGLALGDAFGERFFVPSVRSKIDQRVPPRPPWRYTDDTVMALGIVEVLDENGEIQSDALAETFARRYGAEPNRGYGAGAHQLLQAISAGSDWRTEAADLFGGEGSFGNGASMRVAPVGGYFADDMDAVVEHAERSARITHQHPEGRAGAIAVAVAAAEAWRTRTASAAEARVRIFEAVLENTPESTVRDGLGRAAGLAHDTDVLGAASELGNGSRISAMDTVPFVVWCACQWPDDYEEALWNTVSAGGDRDTTCAMVGGILALRLGMDGLPATWLDAVESLDW